MHASRFVALFACTFLLSGLASLGCGGSSSTGIGPPPPGPDATTGSGNCTPGQQSACACPGSSASGAQTCNSDGHSFGPCGCGEGDAEGTSVADDASNGSKDGGVTGDGAGPEAGGPEAGGSVCNPPDGGLPCEPGKIDCAGSTCSAPATFCCQTASATSGTCDQPGALCAESELHCDEAADCEGGVCCMTINAFSTTVKATCQSACATGSFQLCRSDTECGAGKCIPQTCPLTGTDTEACSTVTGCNAK